MCLYICGRVELLHRRGVNVMIFYVRFVEGTHIDPALIVSSDSPLSLSPFATIPPLLLLCVVFLCVSPFPKLADRISLSFYALSFRGRVPSASRSNIVNVSQLRPFEKYIARTRCRHKDERFFPKAPETIWDFLFSS